MTDPKRFVVGLDLGQAADYTALVVAEVAQSSRPVAEHVFQVRHLQRFPLGTPYPDVCEMLTELRRRPELQHAPLVVDATGVGRAVVDLLRQRRLSPIAVTITSGETAQGERDDWRVPKKDLVGAVQVVLGTGRLKVAQELPLADLLVRELLAFKVKVTAAANATFGAWREGQHDDLVLALALAVWWGLTHPAPSQGPEAVVTGPPPRFPREWAV